MENKIVGHEAMGGIDAHHVHSFEFENETERLAYIPTPTDLKKLAIQIDNNTCWTLIATNPAAWKGMGSGTTHTVVQTEVTLAQGESIETEHGIDSLGKRVVFVSLPSGIHINQDDYEHRYLESEKTRTTKISSGSEAIRINILLKEDVA